MTLEIIGKINITHIAKLTIIGIKTEHIEFKNLVKLFILANIFGNNISILIGTTTLLIQITGYVDFASL